MLIIYKPHIMITNSNAAARVETAANVSRYGAFDAEMRQRLVDRSIPIYVGRCLIS